jgi:arginine exporter protein ArgO
MLGKLSSASDASVRLRRLVCFGYAAFLACWILGFLFWLVKLAMAERLFFYLSGPLLYFTDFPTLYTSGQIVLSPLRSHIYDPLVHLAAYRELVKSQSINVAPAAPGVPWSFLLMAPFCLFDLGTAYLLWNAVWLVAGLGCAALLLRLCGRSNGDIALFSLGLMASYPAQRSWYDGQTGWLLLAFVALYAKFWLEKKQWAAGILLGLLTIKPQYAVFLLIPPLARLKWRTLLSAGLTTLVLVGLSALVFGWPIVASYPALLRANSTAAQAVFPTGMASIRGPLSAVLAEDKSFLLSVLLALAALSALLFLWRRAAGADERFALAVTILAASVLNPHVHIYDLTILGASAALTLPTLSIFQAGAIEERPLKLWTGSFLFYPLIGAISFALYLLGQDSELIARIFCAVNLWLIGLGTAHLTAPRRDCT